MEHVVVAHWTLDQTAVSGLHPLSAFQLQKIEQNNRDAWAKRTRRWGMGWPADHRPIIGCHRSLAWILGLHPVSAGATELSCAIRHTVADADVHLALGILGRNGRSVGSYSTVVPGLTTTTLTADCDGYDEDLVIITLNAWSDEGATLYTSGNLSGARFRQLEVELPAGHGIAFNVSERYVLEILDVAGAGTAAWGDDTPVGPRTILRNPLAGAVNTTYAWPPVKRDLRIENSGNYSLQIKKLGRTEIKGFSVWESDSVDLGDVTSNLRPRKRPSAPAVSRVYGQQHRIAQKKTRVINGGPSFDPSTLDVAGSLILSHWGQLREFTLIAPEYQSMAAALVADPTDDQYKTGTDAAPVTTSKKTYRAAFIVCYPWKDVSGQMEEIKVDYRLKLVSFSGGVWNSSIQNDDYDGEIEVTTDASTEPVFERGALARLRAEQSALLGFSIDESYSWHTLRGAWSRFDGISVKEFTIEDGNPASLRMMRLLIKFGDSSGKSETNRKYMLPPDNACGIYVPAWCAWTQEGAD